MECHKDATVIKNSEPPTMAMEKYMRKKKSETTTSPLHPRYIQKKYHGIQEGHMEK
jgi:hypothetical protein